MSHMNIGAKKRRRVVTYKGLIIKTVVEQKVEHHAVLQKYSNTPCRARRQEAILRRKGHDEYVAEALFVSKILPYKIKKF